jgi:hypothetical protein
MSAAEIEQLNAFLSGVITLGHATAGLFFLRFWKKTGERLFVFFAAAFWLLGAIRIAMLFLDELGEEDRFYWIRLVAYLIILVAIIDKNLRKE